MALKGRVSRSGLMTFGRSSAVRITMLAINTLQVFVLARLLDAESYGLYAALFTNALIAVTIARDPLELLVKRGFEAREGGLDTVYSARGLAILVPLSFVLALATFAGITATQDLAMDVPGYLVLLGGLAVAMASAPRRGEHILRNRTDQVDVADFLLRPIAFLLLVAGAKLAGLDWAGVAVLLGASFILTLAWPNLRAILALRGRIGFGRKSPMRDWLSYSAATGLGAFSKNLDVIIITYAIGGPAVGSYYLLARAADLLAFGNTYAILRYVHQFAAADRRRAKSAVDGIVRRAALVSGSVALAGAAGAILAGPWLLPYIQPGLDRYFPVLAILVAGQAVNGVCGPNGAFLAALRPGRVLAIKAIVQLPGLALLPFAVDSHGLIGAAATSAGMVAIVNIICFVELRRALTERYG